MIGMTVGHYRVTEKIGAGGMGDVFLAEDSRLGRKAAVKFLPAAVATDPERRHRFLREARAAAALNHPRICTVYDVGETDDGLPFIAMEFIEGGPLDAVLKRRRLEIAQVVDVGVQVADALDAAHAARIVHRDIKPANISLSERGQVKVLDFGLATRLAAGQPDALGATTEIQPSSEGVLAGTPRYMSPEQALGKPLDGRSDLFSLGVVLYELITGELPFRGSNVGELLDNVVHAQPTAIARLNYDVPPELERITLKCLQKQPERRYQTARELTVDLKNLSRQLDAGHDRTRGGQPAPVAGAKDVARSDVVITYSELDDQPLTSGRPGWISHLHDNLRVRVSQLSGRPVAVVKHSGGAALADEEAEVLREIPNAKTVVSVLSPPFAHSDGCREVVKSFWKGATDAGRFQVESRSRLLNVIKTPVDAGELPPDLRALYTGLVPYEFFERDPVSGRLREFDEAFGNTAQQRFHERVYDVAYDLSQVLRYLGDSANAGAKRTADPKTVFLAATTSDLEPQRDQLRRELIELGHAVIPQQPLPLVAGELVAAVRGCLEQADIAIHFVGEYFGLVPEATELSVVALQNQVAAAFCETSPLKRLIWIPKGLRPRDDRQSAFVRQLQSEPRSVTGAELIADTLENLKVLLRSRWSREQADRDRPAAKAAAGGVPRVYLICDQLDERNIEPLEDLFYARGVEVSLPAFEAAESEVQQIHIENLRDCDGALVYYGGAGMHWVDFKIRDLQKAAGYREGRPIPACAVYLAPPFNHRKERFKSVSADVVRQAGEEFDPALLEDFVASLRRSKETA